MTLSLDLAQAQRHIELLRGTGDTPVQWQLFVDDKSAERAIKIYAGLNEAGYTLTQYQQQGLGVYLTVNPTDGQGKEIHNITSFDYIFADLDGVALPDSFPITPLFVTSRDATHHHVYWPVTGVTTVREYNYLQRLVAMWLNSDTQVIDPSRVLRLAGSYNLKDRNNPVMYRITQDNGDTVDFEYSVEEICNAFVLSDEKQAELEQWIGSRESINDGSGFNDDPIYREHLKHFAEVVAKPAVKGEGRSYQLITVAGYGYDRGVTLEDTQQILWDYYNPRCIPPWDDSEHDQFNKYIERGYKYYNNAPGCKTASGTFTNHEPVPEPVGGWDKNAELAPEATISYSPIQGDPAYITPEQAALNRTTTTNKSPVQDMAVMFLGENYPHKTLVRVEKIFYRYSGVCWQEVSDDTIKTEIQRLFFAWKLTPSKIKNILDSVAVMVGNDMLVRGQYMSTGQKPNAVIMRNGIVELDDTGNATIKPHTPDYFEFNSLDYDYNPAATCPEFDKFVQSQWPNDPVMMNQLQELYGMMLVANARYQVLPLMIGKSRSGKGTHGAIIRAMIGGHNICAPSVESLLKDVTLHNMSTKKLAMIPEANSVHPSIKGQVLDRLKTISGGDPIQYDRKYLGAATCSEWPLLLISSNEMPDFVDPSGALANRVWAFPFTRSFVGQEDRYLVDRLTTSENIAGVFNWALQGASRLIRNGKVTVSEKSQEFTSEIKRDTFPLADFVDEYCLVDGRVQTELTEIHKFYLMHCREHGVKTPYTQTKLSKVLNSSWLPIGKVRAINSEGKKVTYLTGIMIDPQMKENNTPVFSNVVDLPRKQM